MIFDVEEKESIIEKIENEVLFHRCRETLVKNIHLDKREWLKLNVELIEKNLIESRDSNWDRNFKGGFLYMDIDVFFDENI